MPPSKLRAYGLALAESALLTAAWTVPLLLNHYGFRVADLPKSALLLGLAVLAGMGAFIARLEAGGGWRRSLGSPVALAALATGGAAVLATLLAQQPRLSLVGSAERAMGLVGILALLTCFAAAMTLGRDRERAERLIVALCAGSAPVATYALTQGLGLMPVPGKVESASRVFGTLTNPIFLAAYLMLLVPLSLWLLGRARAERRSLATLGWGLLLLLQLAAMALTQSRGPILGLAAGLVALLLAAGISRGRRAWGWLALGLAVGGIGFLALLNQPNGPLEPLRQAPVIGRFGQLFDAERDSSSARLRIWRSARRLVAEEPGILLHGRGLESFKYAILPHGETYLAGLGQKDRLVDRAHNVLLDALTMSGLPGALALLALYLTWLFAAARLAGLVPGPAESRGLALSLGLGTLAGLSSWFIGPGTVAPGVYAGALTLLGPVLGLGLWLLWRLLRPGAGRPDAAASAASQSRGLGLALLAVGVAMVVEAAFGIQTIGTELVIWCLAGLLAAAAFGPRSLADDLSLPATVIRRSRRAVPAVAGSGAEAVTISAQPAALAWGLSLGAALSVLVYALVLYQVPATRDTWLVLGLTVLAVLIWGGLGGAELELGGLAAVLVAILIAAAYVLLRFLVLSALQDASLLWLVTALWVLAIAGLAALWLRPAASGDISRFGPAAMVLYPFLLVPGMALVFALGLLRVRADITFQSAVASFDAALASGSDQARVDALFQAANQLYDRAVALNRFEDTYPLLFGERYMALGAAAGGNLQAAALAFAKAQELVAEAERLDPQMPFHKVNRGRLQLLFAQTLQASSPQQAVNAAGNAELALQEAFAVVPYDPAVVNELATAKMMQGSEAKLREALPLLEVSRDSLDAENPQTLRLLGQAYRELDRPADARAALAAALTFMPPNSLERPSILVAQAELAREEGKLSEAETLYRQALKGGTADWRLLFNFALILRETDQLAESAAAFQQAATLAPADAQAQIQTALQQVLERQNPGAATAPADPTNPGTAAP